MNLTTSKYQWYSQKGLGTLFLMCALPLHFWTLLMAFRDVSWLTERTNLWDAIGVMSYGMLFTFVESALIFAILSLLGFLIWKTWDHRRRVALLSVLIFITALWSMAGQTYGMYDHSYPLWFAKFIGGQAHPVRVLYALGLIPVAPTIVIPAWLILRSEKSLRFVQDLMDRLSLLAGFYLAFDGIALVIVIVRNVKW